MVEKIATGELLEISNFLIGTHLTPTVKRMVAA
jgi:hypothetical protein